MIYGSKFEHTRLCIELDGKDVLDKLEIDWDIDAVNKLIARYIPFVHNSFGKHSGADNARASSYVEIWAEAANT